MANANAIEWEKKQKMPQEIQKNKSNLLIEILCQLDQPNQTRRHLWNENVYSIDWKKKSVHFHFFFIQPPFLTFLFI